MEFCEVIESSLGFYSYWWIWIIIQLFSPIPYMLLTLWIMDPILRFILRIKDDEWSLFNANNCILSYFQIWFWFWFIYLLCGASCEIWAGEALMVTAIIFDILIYFMCIAIPWSSTEAKALSHKFTNQRLQEYFEKAREMAPQERFSKQAYHYIQTKRRITKTHFEDEEIVTYDGFEDFKYDNWIDESEYPDIPSVNAGDPTLIVTFTFHQKAGDSYTESQLSQLQAEYEAHVATLDNHTHKTRIQTQILKGDLTTKFTKKKKEKSSMIDEFIAENEDNEGLQKMKDKIKTGEKTNLDGIEDDDPVFICSVIPPNEDYGPPCYTNKCLIGICNILAISFPLFVMIDHATRKFSFDIRKTFYSDPQNPNKQYDFKTNPTIPYVGPGRTNLPAVSSLHGQNYSQGNATVPPMAQGQNYMPPTGAGVGQNYPQVNPAVPPMAHGQNYMPPTGAGVGQNYPQVNPTVSNIGPGQNYMPPNPTHGQNYSAGTPSAPYITPNATQEQNYNSQLNPSMSQNYQEQSPLLIQNTAAPPPENPAGREVLVSHFNDVVRHPDAQRYVAPGRFASGQGANPNQPMAMAPVVIQLPVGTKEIPHSYK